MKRITVRSTVRYKREKRKEEAQQLSPPRERRKEKHTPIDQGRKKEERVKEKRDKDIRKT